MNLLTRTRSIFLLTVAPYVGKMFVDLHSSWLRHLVSSHYISALLTRNHDHWNGNKTALSTQYLNVRQFHTCILTIDKTRLQMGSKSATTSSTHEHHSGIACSKPTRSWWIHTITDMSLCLLLEFALGPLQQQCNTTSKQRSLTQHSVVCVTGLCVDS